MFEPIEKSAVSQRLPPLILALLLASAPAAAAPPLSELPAIDLRGFIYRGNTLFTDAELNALLAPYIGRRVTAEELQAAREQVSRFYLERGYVNSGALLPDQNVRDGLIELRITEGRLTELVVTGSDRLHPDYVADRLRGEPDEPLHLPTLQGRIALLHANPLIERINAELTPGLVPGEARLTARVAEADPIEFSAELNNQRSPSVGAERLLLRAAHRNLSGRGDRLGMNLGLTDELNDLGLDYALPLDRNDSTASLYYQRSDAQVVEEPFASLDIDSLSERTGVALKRPFLRTQAGALTLGAALERVRNETRLLGRPYSFSAGADEGVSEVTALRLTQEWLARGRDRVVAVRSTFSFGLDAFGATVHDHLPDSRFTAWLGQAQWVQRLGDAGVQLLLRGDLQLADDTLLPSERFAVGGRATVRGYRENQLVRDNGWAASIEGRLPLVQEESRALVQLALFADAGEAWNHGDAQARERIASLGAGLLWDPSERLHAELWAGARLEKVADGEEGDLQDAGVHFALGWRLR